MTAQAGNGRAHVLVVEDNPADVELLRYALSSAEVQCDLMVIDNGGDALAFFQQRGKYSGSEPPDLAILDLNLPRYDGIEILGAMRANRAFAGVPVAVLSSSPSPRDRAKIEAFHIGRYIMKPPNLEEYLRIGLIVKELLEGGRSVS
ncbi:MAG TPA: response regulator [Bryobacteraceae bacterium]|jgi:DNA-binding response OmpR family regulator|nr:response regulator [Bryobacteraceae bacterium]